MDSYIRLTEDMLPMFAPMIPGWLIESRMDGTDTEFWGMNSFGIPGGAAVLKREGDEKILQYLYIAKDLRGAGRGSRFLLELIYKAHQEGCRRFVTSYMQGQYPAFEKLLLAYPFDSREEMVGSYSCTIQELTKLPYLQGRYGSISPLSKCTEESLKPFYRTLMEEGENLVELPLKKQDYLAECSAVVLEDGKPAGLLLVKREGENAVNIPLMVNYSRNLAAPIEMIRFAVQTTSKVCTPETVCHFSVINEALLQLLEKLGIKPAAKRQRCSLELSFLVSYEQQVEDKFFEELFLADYKSEILGI